MSVSEQPTDTRESGDENIQIDYGEDLPLHEDGAELEPIEIVSRPPESIPEDVSTKERLDRSSDDLLQTTPEGSMRDVEETVDSYRDTPFESTRAHEALDGIDKTETRDTEPYTWLDESAFHAPDSHGSHVDTEETEETVTYQPELHSAVEAEAAMNENTFTDKPDRVDDAVDSERVEIPDWLDEFDSVPIREAPIENEPGEIPDWLRSLAPQEAVSAKVGGGEPIEEPIAIDSFTMRSIETESDGLQEAISTEDLLPDWLSAEAPEYSPTQVSSEPILDWLELMGEEESLITRDDFSAETAADSRTPTIDIEEPPILADDTQPSILSAPEESDGYELETEIAPSITDIEEDISDQVEEFPITADLEVDEETDIIPDWLSEIAYVSPPEEEIPAEESASDIPDWLLGLTEEPEGPSDITTAETAAPDFETKQEAGSEDAIPDWVQELAPREPGVIEDADQFIEPTVEVETIVESTLSQVEESDMLSAEKDDTIEEFQPVDALAIEELIEEERQEPDSILEVQTEELAAIEISEALASEKTLPFSDADTEELTELFEEEELEIQPSPGLMVIETATLNATITAIEHADDIQEETIIPDLSLEPDNISIPTSATDAIQEGEIDSEDLEKIEVSNRDTDETEPELPDWLTSIEESPVFEDEAVWQPSRASEVHEGKIDISETGSPLESSEERIAADIGDLEDEYQIALAQARNALVQSDQVGAIGQYNSLIQSKQYLPEVINDLQGALTQSPTDMTLWQTLGDAYANADRLQDALDAYTKAEQLLG